MKKSFLLLIVALFVNGCSTLTKDQCQNADWKSIGLIDGEKGRPLSYLDRHRYSCDEDSQRINAASYQAGWNEGLKTYCTSVNGHRAGASGQTSSVCDETRFPEFHQQFKLGREVYLLRQEKNSIDSEIKKREEDKSLVADIGRVGALLNGKSYTSDLEEKSRKIDTQMARLSDQAPPETYQNIFLFPNSDEMEQLRNRTGALVGSMVGFGVGHAIQGRYKADGWKWTLGEIATIGFMLGGASDCEPAVSSSASSSDRVCKSSGNLVGFLAWLGFRVWQGYDLFNYQTKNEYSRMTRLQALNGDSFLSQ